MSELYDLGSGYWPDELDINGNLLNEDLSENQPWENWRLHLFGGEADDILEEKSEVDKVLKNLGYKIIKGDEWISVDENNNYPDPEKHKFILGIDMSDSEPYTFECEWDGDAWSNIGGESFTHWKPSDRPSQPK
jgi:hypothetical protein